jgi:hypothetical protein
MEARKPYVKPELEELGAVHDVTGGIFDIGDIFSSIFGGGKPGKPGFPGFPHPGSH